MSIEPSQLNPFRSKTPNPSCTPSLVGIDYISPNTPHGILTLVDALNSMVDAKNEIEGAMEKLENCSAWMLTVDGRKRVPQPTYQKVEEAI